MKIGNYYFSKRQTIVLVILFLGMVVGLNLVQREQITKSRAATISNAFDVYEIPPSPAASPVLANCQGQTCTTQSLAVIIKPKEQRKEPYEAIVATPAPKITPKIGSVGYYIPFRDPSVTVVDPEGAKQQLLREWPNAKIGNWDNIVSQSQANGWNPAFVLALWWEESGGQGHPSYADALGCDPKHPTTDINISLNCVWRAYNHLRPDQFEDLMCIYGGDDFHPAPCTFNVSNPHFPGNVAAKYSILVPSGLGTLVK